jgi:hypothetical protein
VQFLSSKVEVQISAGADGIYFFILLELLSIFSNIDRIYINTIIFTLKSAQIPFPLLQDSLMRFVLPL